MMTKEQALVALDAIEKDIGSLIDTLVGPKATQSVSIQQASIRYGEGGSWLRNYIERMDQ